MSEASQSLGRRIGHGLGWSTASNLVLRMGNLLVSIIMARLIAPEQFGVFAVALTVWTVLSSLAEFGLTADLIRAKDLTRRIPTVATIGLVVSSALALAMMLSAGPLAAAFDSPDSAGVIRLMSLSLVIIGLAVVPSALLQRQIRQGAIFGISGFAMVASTGTMTVLALMGLGPAALAWGQLTGQALTAVAQYVVARVRPRLGFDREIAREAAAFCLPLAFANLLSWVLLSVDNVMVARLLGPAELGIYVLAFNVSSWPMNAVGTSIRAVALPVFSHLGSPARRNGAMTAVSGLTWSISILMGVALGTLAEPVVGLLYGDLWMGAAAALVGLAAFGALRVILDLIATFLVAAGATRAVFAVQVWWLIVLVPTMYVAVRSFGVVGAGWAHVAVVVLAVLPAYLMCLHRVGVDAAQFLRAWIFPTICIVPAAAACWWIGRTIQPSVAAIALGGVTLIALYVAPMLRWGVAQVRALKQFESDPRLEVTTR